jgi:hypothetical protein
MAVTTDPPVPEPTGGETHLPAPESPDGVTDPPPPESPRGVTHVTKLGWKEATQPIPQIFEMYKKNVVAGTALVAVFLVFKGYVLAKGDLSTALGILQYAGLTSVVVAGLLSALPILAAAMLGYTVHREVEYAMHQQTRAWAKGKLLAVTFGAALLSAVFTPWTFMVAAIGIGLVVGIAHGSRHKVLLAFMGLILGIVAVYGVIAMLYTVWLPHEIVKFAPPFVKNRTPAQETGYVLSDDNGWITMLTGDEHQIVRYKDLVTSFTLCERDPNGGWSDIANATTLWQEITKPSFLQFLHTAANKPCPPGAG